MKIDFFVEFPETGLQKADLINFSSVVYIAAKSYAEFQQYKEKLWAINPRVKAAYWPILKKSYWLSPFSFTWELKKIRRELEERSPKKPLKVLIDLELPMLYKKLFFINFFSFWRNKKKIGKLFDDASSLNLEIATAEYDFSAWGWLTNKILRCLGLSYAGSHKRIIMYYSSMLPNWRKKICKRGLKKIYRGQNRNLEVGLGVIDVGILGNESKLSIKNLEKDLRFMKENGTNTAVIFQLSGLNKDYLEVIKKYINFSAE